MADASSKWPVEIERFLKHPIYPGQFDVSTKELPQHALGVPCGLKMYYVNGSPIECTLECDYSTINVSGSHHRLYIIGLRNQINFSGTAHHLFCEGFHNQINFCTEVVGGQICVQGDNQFAFEVGVVSNGTISSEGPKIPKKLTFPSSLKDRRRRRLMWQPTRQLEKDDNEIICDDDEEPDHDVNEDDDDDEIGDDDYEIADAKDDDDDMDN